MDVTGHPLVVLFFRYLSFFAALPDILHTLAKRCYNGSKLRPAKLHELSCFGPNDPHVSRQRTQVRHDQSCCLKGFATTNCSITRSSMGKKVLYRIYFLIIKDKFKVSETFSGLLTTWKHLVKERSFSCSCTNQKNLDFELRLCTWSILERSLKIFFSLLQQ